MEDPIFSGSLFFSKSLKVQYFIIGLALALLLAAVGWSVVATFSDNLEILSSSAPAAAETDGDQKLRQMEGWKTSSSVAPFNLLVKEPNSTKMLPLKPKNEYSFLRCIQLQVVKS